MRITTWLLLALLTPACLFAVQQVTNPPSAPPITAPAPGPIPAPVPGTAVQPAATNSAAPKPLRKKGAQKSPAKKTAAAPRKKETFVEPRTTPLTPGPASVVVSNLNVRGQAKLKSEVVTRLTKGDLVTVVEEIQLKRSAADEPFAWAKILLPTNTHVWVHSSFIDASNHTVVPKKLNLRSGAGENYSVLGTMKRGDTIKEVSRKEDWTQIEAPADAYAFVAAQYLKQEAVVPSESAPVVAQVTETPTIAPPPTETPATPAPAPPAEPVPATASTNPPPENTAADEPPPKRIVDREGLVRGTFSIQAPTKFELVSPQNGRPINYLYASTTNLDLSRYKGMRIIVTGEEGLDTRWRNTPVLTIHKIQVLD